MAELSRGTNVVLASSGPVVVTLAWNDAPSNVDVSCFIVGVDGKVPDDSYMVFYNQSVALGGAVSLSSQDGRGTRFDIELDGLPAAVHKCVFTATLDGAGTFAAVSGLVLEAKVAGAAGATYRVEQAADERALIVAELYRHHTGWKLRAVGQGFNGGLEPLAKAHGVTVEEAPPAQATAAPPVAAPVPAAAPTPEPATVSAGPQVALTRIDLLKREVKVSLEKKNMAKVVLRVGAVIDASGSMSQLYLRGTVQRAFERALAVAACVDDDASMDVWFFGSRSMRAKSVTERDFKGYVERTYPAPRLFGGLGCGNNEPVVMADVIRFYVQDQPRSKLPCFIIFFSDGGICADKKIAQLLIESATLPIFWQFVGIGNADYGVLRKLDTLPGRALDNAAFFALDDLDQVPDAELYDRLLSGVSGWLKEGRQKGILQV